MCYFVGKSCPGSNKDEGNVNVPFFHVDVNNTESSIFARTKSFMNAGRNDSQNETKRAAPAPTEGEVMCSAIKEGDRHYLRAVCIQMQTIYRTRSMSYGEESTNSNPT